MADPTPNWQAFSIQIPGQDLLEKVRNVLETLLIFLEVLKAILETVKAFLIDFGNPVKALVEALIRLILQLFEALKRTGIYAYFDVPNPLIDPNFNRHIGGYEAFTTRFTGSLLDPKDPNRPQPIKGITQSGFVIIVADAEKATGLVRLIKILLQFFGKEFLSPEYQAPANFKVLPAGDKGDPVLSIVRVFQTQPKAVVVEWALPPASRPGDPGFADLVPSFSTAFFPPKFLIERSESNPNVEMSADDLTNKSAVGRVTYIAATNFEARGQPGKTIKRKVRLNDEYGHPFIKFQKYTVVDTGSSTATFLLGQLGTFRYIDTDVVVDKTYYYRVRAFSGSLAVLPDGSLSLSLPQTNVVTEVPFIQWPMQDPKDPPVMGRSTPIGRIRIPNIPAKFDVIDNLKRLFQTAFSFNFHLPLSADKKFDSRGLPLDSTTFNSDVGLGSLKDFAGPLVAFRAIPVLGAAASVANAGTAQFQPDPVTGLPPEMPWQEYFVQANATRLSSVVSGAMLESGSAEAFRALMQGPLPKGTPSTANLASQDTLEKMVFALTKIEPNGTVGQDTATLYGDAFVDPVARLNVLAAINFVKGFTLGGAPPDWIQVSLLRDIVPWSGQLLYELIAKIQALLDAFKGVLDEIKTFISLIVRKIDTLEQFIRYLLSLIDFVDSLEAGFYFLSVPQTSGDAGDWISLINNAGGTPPPSGPGGYTGGVGLAYVGLDVSAYAAAFGLIF